ncbi:MAG: hypothetical protein HC933_18595 [Pleurocapsa sp. SU_196_0]|nr:hypothetical protein [Pleurocapsa sp. SU_196_0]
MPKTDKPIPSTTLELTALTPQARNARQRSTRGKELIQRSLEEIGAARSIVIDENNQVLAGNGTLEGALNAGLSKVLVVETDGDTLVAVRRSNLSDAQKEKLALYDNRTAELASWNPSALKAIACDVDTSSLWDKTELETITKLATPKKEFRIESDDTPNDPEDNDGEQRDPPSKPASPPPSSLRPITLILTAELNRDWQQFKANIGTQSDLKAFARMLEEVKS